MSRSRSNCFMAMAAVVELALTPLAGAQQPFEDTTFDEVGKHLDRGGNAYMYVSTEDWAEKIFKYLDEIEATAVARAPAERRGRLTKGFATFRSVIEQTGLPKVSGIGLSSAAVGKGLYRNKAILYHGPQAGSVWPLLGQEPVDLKSLDFLPKNTVAAIYGDFDLNLLWRWLNTAAAGVGTRPMKRGLQQARQNFQQQGIDIDQFIASTAGQWGVVMTMNPDVRYPFPANNTTLHVPDTSLMVLIKVKDAQIFNYLDQRIGQLNPNIQRLDEPDLKQRSIPVPLPVPIKLVPTIALTKGYLIIATNDAIVRDALAVYEGRQKGLRATPAFEQYSHQVPTSGNHYHFISPVLVKEMLSLLKEGSRNAPMEEQARVMLTNLYNSVPEDLFVYGVIRNSDEGLVMTQNSNVSISDMLMLQGVVMPLSMMAGAVIPALGRARQTARTTGCYNNLRQIGLGIMLYAADHNGKLPPNFLELVQKAYLKDGKIWGCPARQNPGTSALTSDFIYVGAGLTEKTPHPATTIISYDKPGNHGKQQMNILFLDGHVETVQAPNIEGAAEQRDWRIGNR